MLNTCRRALYSSISVCEILHIRGPKSRSSAMIYDVWNFAEFAGH